MLNLDEKQLKSLHTKVSPFERTSKDSESSEDLVIFRLNRPSSQKVRLSKLAVECASISCVFQPREEFFVSRVDGFFSLLGNYSAILPFKINEAEIRSERAFRPFGGKRTGTRKTLVFPVKSEEVHGICAVEECGKSGENVFPRSRREFP